MCRALLAALLAAAACNPYDPDLGGAPFTCGTDEPRCPQGYLAVDVSPIRCECQRPSGIDAGAYVCDGDPNEPNETFTTATATLVGVNLAQNFTGLAICPRTEEDNYALEATQGTLITVRVTFDRTRSAPRVDILNNSGASLPTMNETPEPGVVVVTHRANFSSRYYARIRADQEVNYDLRLMLTPQS